MENKENRILSKNPISHFILKIDLHKIAENELEILINSFKPSFDRLEQVIQPNIEVSIRKDNSTINKVDKISYVLVKDSEKSKLTFSGNANFILFETNKYIDKQTYISILSLLLKSIEDNKLSLQSKRIGMRFINNFPCDSIKSISKTFNSHIAKNIVYMASKESINRAICQEEFNFDICRSRIQYGILNKYYPAILKNFDLTLDIDSYDGTLQDFQNWSTVIDELNHRSYQMFVANINETFLNSLK